MVLSEEQNQRKKMGKLFKKVICNEGGDFTKMKRLLSLAVAVSLLGAFSGYVFAGKNHDDTPGHECENGVHQNNPHCNPSSSASVTATPTPSETPCNPEQLITLVVAEETEPITLTIGDDELVPCVNPTIIPTVTVIPVPTSPTCSSYEHLNNAGTKCLKYEYGGAPTSSWTQEDYDKNFPGEDKFHGLAK